MTGIKSRIFPSVLTVTSSLAAGYVHRCVFLFSFSLHFHLLCFLFIINFLQDSSWLLDMFGEPGGSVGSGGGSSHTCAWSCPRKLRKRNHLCSLPAAVWTAAAAVWVKLYWTLSRHHCSQKKKESPTEGVGSAVGEDELCVCAGCDSVFPPAAPLGPGRVFLWLVLNTESIPFPCKDDFSSKFCVCTAAKMLP